VDRERVGRTRERAVMVCVCVRACVYRTLTHASVCFGIGSLQACVLVLAHCKRVFWYWLTASVCHIRLRGEQSQSAPALSHIPRGRVALTFHLREGSNVTRRRAEEARLDASSGRSGHRNESRP
jgi:hypothetical protein